MCVPMSKQCECRRVHTCATMYTCVRARGVVGETLAGGPQDRFKVFLRLEAGVGTDDFSVSLMPGTFAKDPDGHQVRSKKGHGRRARFISWVRECLNPRGFAPLDAEFFSPQRFLRLEGWGPSKKEAARTFILDSQSSRQCG